jgi:lipoate-protein ligase B
MADQEGAAAQPGVLEAAWLGRVDYREMWTWQRRRFEARLAGECEDIVTLLEHPPTYTLGRRSTSDEILYSTERRRELGISLFEVDRGGRATYHGPGQIVGYPIVALGHRYDVLKYLRGIEDALIGALAEVAIEGQRDPRHTGVWVGDNKIAAIGVRITRGVTMHGFALNVETDLSMFEGIVPCGIEDHWVTSVAAETGMHFRLDEVALILGTHLAGAMGRTLDWVTPKDVPRALARARAAEELRLIS